MGYAFDSQPDSDERRLPTPRMMEAFNAVMEAGSVSAAARCLGVSQPAVSRLLKQFEDELGFALFHRAKGKLTPTPEAHRLSIDVGNALDGIDRVARHDRESHLANLRGDDCSRRLCAGRTTRPTNRCA